MNENFSLELFAEIFGSTSARDSLGNPHDFTHAPAVPILDTPQPLRDFGKSGAASELCRVLETEIMMDKLVGPTRDIAAPPPATPKPAAPAPGSNALGEFIKSWSDRSMPLPAKASSRKQIIDGKLG